MLGACGSAGLHCFDYDGNKLWGRDMGRFAVTNGYASSPIIVDDTVVAACGPGEPTLLIALDKQTGETLWKKNETYKGNSWSTPVAARIGGRDQIVMSFGGEVSGYDLRTGEVVWSCRGLDKWVYASAAIAGDMAVVTSDGRAIGLEATRQKMKRLWSEGFPGVCGTGVIVGDHFWSLDNGGVIRCLEARSGQEIHKQRSPVGGAFGSMIFAAGRLYCTTRKGATLVMNPDPQSPSILALNSLGEESHATPAISNGELFLRTHHAVYCIAGD